MGVDRDDVERAPVDERDELLEAAVLIYLRGLGVPDGPAATGSNSQ